MENKGYVATIGMFDGVHRGHQYVLRQVAEAARQQGLPAMAITFDRPPRQGLLLTPLDDKVALLARAGADRVVVLPFTDSLRLMTARQFMQHVLYSQYHVSTLLTGYDNRFGHNREEGFDDYARYGHEMGMQVRRLDAWGSVSSSLIRQQLTEGRVAEAAAGLGRRYSLAGHVVHGEHVGTGLGFPTANIVPDEAAQLVPAAGVYAVTARVGDHGEEHHAMMNIGRRPTFDGRQQTLEVHILRMHGDLYGQPLRVDFVERLRDERRFDSADALKAQLERDAEQAEAVLSGNKQ